jgi:type VI secretion system protein VasG
MIDAILTGTLLPALSREFLGRMLSGETMREVNISVKDGDFEYRFA